MRSGLSQKNILLGITGGIAAYKSAELVRRLKQAGASVRVVMTQNAQSFITPLTLQALSGEEVRDSLLDSKAEAAMGHIELARWADLILIAPASANTLAELAHGMAGNLLTTLCLASQAPCLLCPAMNMHMWHKASVQQNIANLKQYGFELLGPEAGEQACGDVGLGRMIEIETIMAHLEQKTLSAEQVLATKQVLITVGPTREYLDPVRYLSNESSGRMGAAMAIAAQQAGAQVTVVSGPTSMNYPPSIEVVNVISAAEMFEQVKSKINHCQLFISTAAVSDYRFKQSSSQKLKKNKESLTVSLEKNPDILSFVGQNKLCDFIVGFAAETQQLAHYATQKLINKNADLIVANQVGIEGNGFNSEKNQVTVYGQQNKITPFEYLDKTILAQQLIKFIALEMEIKNEKCTTKNS